MLSVGNIETLLNRLHLLDFTVTNVTVDASGDYITAFDPDTNFSTVKRAVQGDKIFRGKVTDLGQLFIDLEDDIWVDGNKVKIAVAFEQGTGAFGTKVKMMVKHLEVVVDGQVKSFLSFEAYNSYLKITSERG